MFAGLKLRGSARVLARPRVQVSGVSPENSVRRDAEDHTRGRVCSPELPETVGSARSFRKWFLRIAGPSAILTAARIKRLCGSATLGLDDEVYP
jgi:hypothetical protein